MCHNVFSFPASCYGHLGDPLLDTMISAATCFGEHRDSFCGSEGVEFLDHKIGVRVALVDTANRIPVCTHRLSFLPHLITLGITDFFILAARIGVLWILTCVSLMTPDVEHLLK